MRINFHYNKKKSDLQAISDKRAVTIDGYFPTVKVKDVFQRQRREREILMEDEEIVRLFWERNETAVGELQQKYGARLIRFANGILHSRGDSEECVNDTYWKAWNTIPPQRPEQLSAYLLKLCRFTAFDMLDRKKAQKRSAELVELTAEMEQCLPASEEDKAVSAEELGELMTGFLKTLSRESRLLFIRRYWFADSVHEISQRYHITESKVKVSLFRTRNKLRDYLKKEGISL